MAKLTLEKTTIRNLRVRTDLRTGILTTGVSITCACPPPPPPPPQSNNLCPQGPKGTVLCNNHLDSADSLC